LLPGPFPPRKSKAPWVIAAVLVLVVALAGLSVYLYFALRGESGTSASSSLSAQDEIRATVKGMESAYNDGDADKLGTYFCANRKVMSSSKLQTVLAQKGTMSTTVSNIVVNGERATAKVTFRFSKASADTDTEYQSYVYEDGAWKYCGLAGSSSPST
jgi:hypothetical protein